MNRRLFLQKLSDYHLKELTKLLLDLDMRGVWTTDNQVINNYLNTWYDHKKGNERVSCLRDDVYKEVVYRWSQYLQ